TLLIVSASYTKGLRGPPKWRNTNILRQGGGDCATAARPLRQPVGSDDMHLADDAPGSICQFTRRTIHDFLAAVHIHPVREVAATLRPAIIGMLGDNLPVITARIVPALWLA